MFKIPPYILRIPQIVLILLRISEFSNKYFNINTLKEIQKYFENDIVLNLIH